MKRSGPLARKAPLERRQRIAPGRGPSGSRLGTAAAPLRRRSVLKPKRNPLARYLKTIHSLIVRTRDGWRCLWCQRNRESSPGLVLQAAHIYSVGAHRRMRYLTENAICLCYRCHMHVWHRDGGGLEWCYANLEAARMQRLAIVASTRGRTPLDLQLVRIGLEHEAALLGVPLPPQPRIAA